MKSGPENMEGWREGEAIQPLYGLAYFAMRQRNITGYGNCTELDVNVVDDKWNRRQRETELVLPAYLLLSAGFRISRLFVVEVDQQSDQMEVRSSWYTTPRFPRRD